jgi:DNA-binding NarL/FixJ family response regulator
VRVVVADDALILREGLARLLTEAGFEVVGLAGDAEQLLAVVEEQQPDIAIVDIRMPPTHTNEGLHAAREIRSRWPAVGVIVLSQYLQPSYAFELLEHGAEGVGYLLKDRLSDLEELTSSVRRVAEGGSVLDPSVVAQLVDRPRGDEDPLHVLSQREREVLSLMAEGKSNRAIGETLWISEHTVEKHVNGIFAKLRLPSSPDEHRRVLAVLSYLEAR